MRNFPIVRLDELVMSTFHQDNRIGSDIIGLFYEELKNKVYIKEELKKQELFYFKQLEDKGFFKNVKEFLVKCLKGLIYHLEDCKIQAV